MNNSVAPLLKNRADKIDGDEDILSRFAVENRFARHRRNFPLQSAQVDAFWLLIVLDIMENIYTLPIFDYPIYSPWLS